MSNQKGERDVSDVVSIVGPGMTVDGDCQTDGTLRVEGRVTGSVRAGKAVVVGREGLIQGDVTTRDAVVAGRVEGRIEASSRLELKATCQVEADIRTRSVKLEEGGYVEGRILMGEAAGAADSPQPSTGRPGDGAERA